MAVDRVLHANDLPGRPPRLALRHLAKAVSWRAVGTLDTFILSLLLLTFLGPLLGIPPQGRGHAHTAGLIAATEVVTKIALFYGHEWLWARWRWAVARREQHRRSLVKAVSWRAFASLDTTLLAWFYTGNFRMAVSIGGAEVVTKILLYYLHERVWEHVPLGRPD